MYPKKRSAAIPQTVHDFAIQACPHPSGIVAESLWRRLGIKASMALDTAKRWDSDHKTLTEMGDNYAYAARAAKDVAAALRVLAHEYNEALGMLR